MITQSVLHPHLINRNIFVVKKIRSRVIKYGTVEKSKVLSFSRIDLVFTLGDFQIRRRQMSLRLAFSATVHNIQGKILYRVVLDPFHTH